jgi:hypothetical protein
MMNRGDDDEPRKENEDDGRVGENDNNEPGRRREGWQ